MNAILGHQLSTITGIQIMPVASYACEKPNSDRWFTSASDKGDDFI